MTFQKKRTIGKAKFAAIRNGRWSKERFGHNLSITALRRLPDGTLILTKIIPRFDTSINI